MKLNVGNAKDREPQCIHNHFVCSVNAEETGIHRAVKNTLETFVRVVAQGIGCHHVPAARKPDAFTVRKQRQGDLKPIGQYLRP